MKNRIATILSYKPIHPELFDTKQGWLECWFAPTYLAAIKKGTTDAIRAILTEEIPGVYSFEMFNLGFCQMLMDEVENYDKSNLPKHRPNTMNNYGLVLNNIGMEPMFDLLLDYVRPLTRVLYPQFGGESLDHHHTFVVQYKIGEDLSLDMHTDDSEVTINLNLHDNFSGASLNFCGVQGNLDLRTHKLSYHHKKGRAVIHAGTHRHGAADITTGERHNLIFWCMSSNYRKGEDFRPTRIEEGVTPDLVCLSKTHDEDYYFWVTHTETKKEKEGLFF